MVGNLLHELRGHSITLEEDSVFGRKEVMGSLE